MTNMKEKKTYNLRKDSLIIGSVEQGYTLSIVGNGEVIHTTPVEHFIQNPDMSFRDIITEDAYYHFVL